MSRSKFILDRNYKKLIEFVGVSFREAIKKAELPEDLLSRKIPSVTTEEYIRFLDAIKEVSQDKSLPIKVALLEDLESFSPPIFAAYCSKNALTCMKRLSIYKKLIGPLVFNIEENKESITMEMLFEKEELDLPEFLVATEMVFLVQLMRKATKKHIVPLEIETKHSLDNIEYENFFGVRPKVGKRNVLTISMEDALTPFISENISMWEFFEPELKKRLSELEIDDTYSARVRSALIELLPGGEGNIDDVAKKLGCSKRTLQRKLSEESTTFQKQLNHTRELLAKHYLKSSDMTSDDIAYLIGYQDLNSFIRAFHAWTGMTVSEYKKSCI